MSFLLLKLKFRIYTLFPTIYCPFVFGAEVHSSRGAHKRDKSEVCVLERGHYKIQTLLTIV